MEIPELWSVTSAGPSASLRFLGCLATHRGTSNLSRLITTARLIVSLRTDNRRWGWHNYLAPIFPCFSKVFMYECTLDTHFHTRLTIISDLLGGGRLNNMSAPTESPRGSNPPLPPLHCSRVYGYYRPLTRYGPLFLLHPNLFQPSTSTNIPDSLLFY